MDEEQFLDVLYALCPEDDFLESILPAFAAVMKTSSANVAVVDRRSGSIDQKIIGIDSEYLTQVGHYFLPKNPWVKAGFAAQETNPLYLTSSRISHGAELLPPDIYRETEYFRDFNRHTGVGDDMICAYAPVGHFLIGFGAAVGGRLFSEEDRNQLRRLLPHISRVLKLHLSFVSRRFADGAPQLMHTSLPVLTLQNRVLVSANTAARRAIENGGVARLRGGRIRFEVDECNRALDQMSRNDTRELACTIVANGKRWLVQFVLRAAPAILGRVGGGAPVITVIMTPLDATGATREKMLAALPLTQMERKVLACLVDGLGVPAVAERLARSEETVRSHVNSLRTKLHATSQADLGRIGALLLAV